MGCVLTAELGGGVGWGEGGGHQGVCVVCGQLGWGGGGGEASAVCGVGVWTAELVCVCEGGGGGGIRVYGLCVDS